VCRTVNSVLNALALAALFQMCCSSWPFDDALSSDTHETATYGVLVLSPVLALASNLCKRTCQQEPMQDSRAALMGSLDKDSSSHDAGGQTEGTCLQRYLVLCRQTLKL
jgi:hypothetical protein